MRRRKFLMGIPIIGISGFVPEIIVNDPPNGKELQGGTERNLGIALLLSRLDLEKSGLTKVEALKNSPDRAANELLLYYRSRYSVEHPIDRRLKDESLGHGATKKEMATADNALDHIFVGQPSYPPHFCGADIDWDTNPYPDKEWVWQLNRMYFWTDMGKAYWNTGEEKYAREWCLQLVDWVAKNPHDDRHAYAWRSIEAGIRGFSWTGLYQRFLDAPSFDPEVLVTFLTSFYDHASYLMSTYSKGSNWALMEAEGLAFIAITFPEFKDSDNWLTEAIQRFNKEIYNQVYGDGFQRELSISYHIGCIDWFLRTYELAAMNGSQTLFPKSYLAVLEKMCEVPMKVCFPDGTNAQFGDSWKGEPGQYESKFKKWAELFDRADFLYMATDGQEGKAPDATTYALKKSGFYSMRSNWDKDAICMVLKCGPDGGFHCQADNGTFALYAGRRHLMPDSGSYIYSGNKEGRDWFRQTKVHQTLTLNGENSAFRPKLLLWKPGKELDILVVENKSYPDLVHRRAVLFVEKKYFVIVDEALGDALGNIDLHFQLGPGEAIFDDRNRSVRSDFEDGWNVLVKTSDQRGLSLEKEEGKVSFVYNEKDPRPAFRYRIRKGKKQGIRFVTVVQPYSGKYPMEMEPRIMGNPEIGSAHLNLEIVVDGKKKRIRYGLK